MEDKAAVIDFHTHDFPETVAPRALKMLAKSSRMLPASDGTRQGLLASMAAAGIHTSVILPVATRESQVSSINDRAIAAGKEEAGTGRLPALIRFGCMHPAFADAERELERLAEAGVLGIKIHPYFQEADIDDPAFIRILARCAARGLIVVCHTGEDIGFPGISRATPQMTARALEKAPGVRFVAAHMGGWGNWGEVVRHLRDTEAFLDTSFSFGSVRRTDGTEANGLTEERMEMLDAEAFTAIVEGIGASRVLFGTDSPWTSQSDSVKQIRALPLSGDEKEGILGGNARRLLNML